MVKGFYRCPVCGKIVQVEEEGFGKLACCGKPMDEMTANSTDAAQEKHVPQVSVDGSKVSVCVGSVVHPMSEEHSIRWIYLDMENGGQFRYLSPNQAPNAEFIIPEGEKALAVYSYCNLHGLWVANL